MNREDLPQAIQFVAGTLVEQLTGKSVSELANAEVRVGNYRSAADRAVQTRFGREVVLDFELAISGATVPVADDGAVQVDSLDLGSDAGTEDLIWLRRCGDPLADDAAELARVFADIGTFTEGDDEIHGDAAAWAAAVHEARSEITPSLAGLDVVPAAFASLADTSFALVTTLEHFCTYDSEGAYYPRWDGSGDDRSPSAQYLELNLIERKLRRNQLYVYLLVPASSLIGSTSSGENAYREIVMRLYATGDTAQPFATQTVHSVVARRASTFHDIVVFHAEDGLGIPIPAAAESALGTDVRALLDVLPRDTSDVARDLGDFDQPGGSGQGQTFRLLAVVQGSPSFPDGVVSLSDDAVRTLEVPVGQVQAVAALPEVLRLELPKRRHTSMNEARIDISHTDFTTAINAIDSTKQDGTGVVIGVIDGGIDGSHPAFAGRIISVWDQTTPGVAVATPHPSSPAANNSANAAYNSMNYGTELTGAAVSGATDPGGHGTHVAGIAAGALVTTGTTVDCDPGIATQARLVVVKTNFSDAGIMDGARYIFERASEQGTDGWPCVINMSLSGHADPHDGTDDLSVALMGTVTDSSGDPLPGRILVAACGNQRQQSAHVDRELGVGVHHFDVRLNAGPKGPGSSFNSFTFWIRQPGDEHNPVPLRFWARRDGSTAVATDSAAQGAGPVVNNFSYPGGVIIQTIITCNTPDPGNGDTEVTFIWRRLDSGTPAGLPIENWTITVLNYGFFQEPVLLHGWAISERPAFRNTEADDNRYLVGSPAAAEAVVSVASTNAKLSWPTTLPAPNDVGRFNELAPTLHDISSFSNRGPLRPNSQNQFTALGLTFNLAPPAIDVAAPGSAILSAHSSQLALSPGAQFLKPLGKSRAIVFEGTSMACPVVTGVVAGILAVEPTLNFRQLKERMRTKLNVPSSSRFSTLPEGHNDWGWGLLNGTQLLP